MQLYDRARILEKQPQPEDELTNPLEMSRKLKQKHP